MAVNDILCSDLSPIQFVPINEVKPGKYNTYNRKLFLFKDQIARWANQDGYCYPVQTVGTDPDNPDADRITLQFITHSLDPLTYTIYRNDLSIYLGPTNLDTINAPYPTNPKILWQKYIDTTGWESGCKFIVISAPTGEQWQSECLDVQEQHPDTVLVEFHNTFNTQDFIFWSDVPFVGWFRFRGGFDNSFIPKSTGKEYIDQPQNAYYLNEIPYQLANLYAVGLPDEWAYKLSNYLRLDTTNIDGDGFIANPGEEMERVFTIGAPKKIWNQAIRPRSNKFSKIVNGGIIDTDVALMISTDARDWGPNQLNSSGSTDPVLTDINLRP